MNKYKMNLRRLQKGEKLIRLALRSGTLRDRDWDLASQGRVIGALHLLEDAVRRQSNYVAERERSQY